MIEHVKRACLKSTITLFAVVIVTSFLLRKLRGHKSTSESPETSWTIPNLTVSSTNFTNSTKVVSTVTVPTKHVPTTTALPYYEQFTSREMQILLDVLSRYNWRRWWRMNTRNNHSWPSRPPMVNLRRRARSVDERTFRNLTIKNTKSGRSALIEVKAQLPSKDRFTEDRFKGLVKSLLDKLRRKNGYELVNGDAIDREEILAEEYHDNSRPIIKPSFECDEWDSKRSICFYDRNIGDTITFQLQLEDLHKVHVMSIHWRQEYHIRHSNTTKFVNIIPEDCLWNVVIGGNGLEFRISPITEMDFDFNRFTALVTLLQLDRQHRNPIVQKVTFAIRPVPNDLGPVYHGEQIILNFESYGSVPTESLHYHWYVEHDKGINPLPSNMKVSLRGSAMVISELRTEQEGIVACAVYNSKNIFLTKKRFLIKEINKDILIRPSQTVLEVRVKDFTQKRQIRQTINRKTVGSPEQPTHLGLNPLLYQQQQYNMAHSNVYNGVNLTEQLMQSNNLITQPISGTINPLMLYDQDFMLKTPEPSNSIVTPIQKSTHQRPQPCFKPPCSSFIEVSLPQFSIDDLSQVPMKKLIENSQNNFKLVDQIAVIISGCVSDRECSGFAHCVFSEFESKGICKCMAGYEGNGLFCWEIFLPGHPPILSSQQAGMISEQDSLNSQHDDLNPLETNLNLQHASLNPKETSSNLQQVNLNSQQANLNSQQANLNSQQANWNLQPVNFNPNQTNLILQNSSSSLQQTSLNSQHDNLNPQQTNWNTQQISLNPYQTSFNSQQTK